MNWLIISSIYLVIVSIASLPCFLFWSGAVKRISIRFQLKPKVMTFMSVVLAILTIFLLNIELEGGILSVPTMVIVLSLIWSFVLFLALLSYERFTKKHA